MTTEPDWADKMAELVYGDWVLNGNFCTPVAIALRKARADGKREAEEIKSSSRQDRRQVKSEPRLGVTHKDGDPTNNDIDNLELRKY